MNDHGMQSLGAENNLQDMEIKKEKKVTKLILNFPLGEDPSICDKIAQYADEISQWRCSGGGYQFKTHPLACKDDEIEFEEDTMEYSYGNH